MLPITAYIDALGCEQQRSIFLKGLEIDISERIATHSHTIAFPLIGRGRRWSLTIPTAGKFPIDEHTIRLKCLATQNPENHLAPAEYIPQALVVFDSLGGAHTVAALLQESPTPLVSFIRQNCSIKRRGHLRAAIESIHRALIGPLPTHGHLSKERIGFGQQGELFLCDYPIVGTAERSDATTLGKAALLLYIGACNTGAIRELLSDPQPETLEHTRRLRCILSAAEHHGATALATLCSAILNEASKSTICSAILGLANQRFMPLELLQPLLASRTPQCILTAPQDHSLPEEKLLTVDFALCDSVEIASDEIVRYRRGGRWGYAHTNGEAIIIEREIIAAYDFEEGRAVIRTPRGYGLVDSSGRLVMNDVWEQMCWYGDENVCIASDNLDRWHIYDRMGRQLTTVACDWMGDASEGFVVARRGARFGYFGTDGQRRTDFLYDEAFSFCEGRALVRRKGDYFHIDTSFHRVAE